jgi:hypothetical protein
MFFDPLAKDPTSLKESIFIKNDIAVKSNIIINTLDTKELEKLFAATVSKSPMALTPTTHRKEMTTVIQDSNRSRSISLKIGSLRNQGLTIDAIATAIIHLDDKAFTLELLESIQQLVPTNEELLELSKTDGKDLQEPDQLFWKVCSLWILTN